MRAWMRVCVCVSQTYEDVWRKSGVRSQIAQPTDAQKERINPYRDDSFLCGGTL